MTTLHRTGGDMKLFTAIILMPALGAVRANSYQEFIFDHDSTGYQASISFTTDLPPDSALRRMYSFEHFLEYKTGLGKAKIADSTDTSYCILTTLELPFYSMQLRLRRVLRVTEGLMEFKLVSFRQAPSLVPEVLEISGVYRAGRTGNSTEVHLFQAARNGSRISFIWRILLEASLRNYYQSIRRYITQSR